MDEPFTLVGNERSGKRGRERLEALRERLSVALGAPVDGERFRFRGPLVIRRRPEGLKVLAPAAAQRKKAA